ncbi:MAG: DUF1499 domain-containing protein [Spirochaetaceae bacterium]|nr:MAG: DUF1499 domain-containing protein [Spirochaetaceae bacterium]
MQYLWYVLGALAVAGVSFGVAQNFRSVAGGVVTDGDMTRLAACPGSPNCVSSYAGSGYASLDPWPYGQVDRSAAHEALISVLQDEARVTIERDDENYVHSVFRSPLFRFRDDVEFYFPDDEPVIHFRAASRVGQGDLGVHERRMRMLAEQYSSAIESQTE